MSIFSKQNLAAIEQQSASPARPLVLLVDDKDANVSVMAAILRPHFELIEAHDGYEALASISNLADPNDLACVVSDHRMPKMTGVQLFERLFNLLPYTRRVLVTGYMDMDAIVESINRSEVYRFVPKPFDAADFLHTVHSAAASYAAHRARAEYVAALEQQCGAAGEAVAAARARYEAAEAALRALAKPDPAADDTTAARA